MDMNYILSKLPYNTYFDLMNSIKEGKARIKIMRSDCVQIAGLKHPYFSTLGMYIGFLIATIFIVWLIIQSHNFWLLLYIPINFILTHFMMFVPKMKYIAGCILLLDLFIIKLPSVFMITSVNIIIISIFYNIWWDIVYKQAIRELEYNEEAFLWSWNRAGIGIEDCYGNTYSKLSINNDETKINNKNLELSNIVIKGLNVPNINEAIPMVYEFYKKQGVELDNIDLNSEDKNKVLTQLIMIGLDTNNIDEAILKTKEFYNL